MYILKMRDLYRHLSNAADRGDEAANIIGDIIVKMPWRDREEGLARNR